MFICTDKAVSARKLICPLVFVESVLHGSVSLNIYFWLILIVSVLLLARGVIKGFRNGFVKEAEGLAAGICALVALILISSLAMGAMGDKVSTKVMTIALLIVLGAMYALFKIIFSSLKLFAGLPVISLVDHILGAAAGAAKTFILLYVVDYLARIWLNL